MKDKSVAYVAALACTFIAAAQAQITLTGKAYGAGYLTNCMVTYADAMGQKGSAMTDGSGSYSMEIAGVTAPQQLSGNLLRLARGAGCVDQGTQRALPVSLGALIPNYPAGTTSAVATINGLTTLTYYTKKNFEAPQIKPVQAFLGGDNFNAAAFYGQFGPFMGIRDAANGGTVDLLATIQAGDANDAKAQALSVEVINSLSAGSAALAGLKPSVTTDQAAEAMVVACFPAGIAYLQSGKIFDLTQAEALVAVFNKALGGAPQDVVRAGATTIAAMNARLKAIGDAGAAPSTLPALAGVLNVGETSVAKALYALGSGTMSPAQFSAAFTGSALDATLSQATIVPEGTVHTTPGRLASYLAEAPVPAPGISRSTGL